MEHHSIVIGGKIYSLRVAKGMTQEQLAAILCVSPAAVSKWERKLANPSIEMLWEMADYFECSIDELVGREEKRLAKVGIYNSEKLRLVEVALDSRNHRLSRRSRSFLLRSPQRSHRIQPRIL